MSKARLALSLPILAFELAIGVIGGRGFYHLARAFVWLHEGCKTHVFVVVMQVRRWVQGVPTWRFSDLGAGIQPRTKRQRAIADADPRVLRHECTCDDKHCEAKIGRYSVNPFPGLSLEQVRARLGFVKDTVERQVNTLLDEELRRIDQKQQPPGAN